MFTWEFGCLMCLCVIIWLRSWECWARSSTILLERSRRSLIKTGYWSSLRFRRAAAWILPWCRCVQFNSNSIGGAKLKEVFLNQEISWWLTSVRGLTLLSKVSFGIYSLPCRNKTLSIEEAYLGTMPESRLKTLRKESERFSIEIKEKEADNIVLRKQIREIKSAIHQTQRDYDATAKGTSKAENQRIKMQKLLKRQKVANEVNAQEKEIGELRLELKRLSKKTFPQFDERIWWWWLSLVVTSFISRH